MRSATITFGLAMATASLLLATGCSSTTTGSGAPTAAAPSATATAPPSDAGPTSPASHGIPGSGNPSDAPKVTTTLDTTKYQQDPCSAFTPAQRQQFGVIAAGIQQPSPLGPVCTWTVTNGTIAIQFGVHPFTGTTHTGLQNVYETSRAGSLRRLPDVQGQPEVGYVTSPFGPGKCVVYLGATDSVDYQLKTLINSGPDYADPCGLAQRLAVAATTTMKAGA